MTIAVAIVCKAPVAGSSKTRLCPPLRPEECAGISECFIRDLSRTISHLAADGVVGYALYTPRGSEAALRKLLPDGFEFTLQTEGNLGARLHQGMIDLLSAGHEGAILVNSDSPTLPLSILRDAVDATRRADCVVLSPALDGGYTLIGLSKPHARLFTDIPWSTSAVYDLTFRRAQEMKLPVVTVSGWYDVDDEASLRILEVELAGGGVRFSDLSGADAPATRRFLSERQLPATGLAGRLTPDA